MSTLDALRQAVLASPDDDLPRLVFADYLEENGDPDRAAFIRAQIELAKTPEYEPFAVLCKTRKRGWITGVMRDYSLSRFLHKAPRPIEWIGTNFQNWSGTPFRRGFGWAVSLLHLTALDQAMPELLAHEPVGELHLRTATLDQWREFAASPWLPHIRSLALTGLSSPNEPLRCLRESPYTTGITSLRLDHTNVPSMEFILGPLFAAPLGKQLTSLSMRLGYGHADEWLEAIATNRHVRLTEFDLYRMGFGPAAARVFVDSRLAQQAEILRLNGNPLMFGGVAILATASYRLRILDLTETTLDESAIGPLAHSPEFRSLRKLVLTGNKFGTDAIKAIARSSNLAGLRSLGLANTDCDNAGVRYLTRGVVWPNLVELDLRKNRIDGIGAKHLLTAPPAPDLTSLVLPTNITPDVRAELKAKFGEVVSWDE